jgi:hypothetical protein
MIRTQTQRIGEELGAIIGEFENNGLGEGEDVKVLRAIKNVLGKLSDKEMARVIDLLGSARGGDDPTKAKAKVAEAFGGQKTIVVELRQLLLEYQRQQELYELSLRFAQLAARQNGNLKEAKRLVRLSMGKNLDRFDEAQKISLSVQKDEQTAIRDEAMGVINKLGALAKDTDSSIADRLNESLKSAQKNRIEESLRNAVDELKGGMLFRATKSEQESRNQLRELSRLVAPPKDAQEILRQAAAELERIIVDQKQTIAFTQTLRGETVRASSEPFFDAEDKQGDVVDRTDGVQKDIEHLVPLASEQCKKAEDRMQEARSQILEKRRDDTLKSQEQAVIHLEAARKLVLEELNKEEKKDQAPLDKLALARELKEKVSELKKEQEEIKKQTEAVKDQPKAKENKPAEKLAQISPEQARLQAQARELQPQAATESIPAADAIAEAAREMGKAQQAIDKAAQDAKPQKDAPKLDQATAPQQAAIDSLAKAEKLLDKQIAQLEQAKADLDKLEQTREKIAELIKNENKIEIATAKAEAMQPKPADAAKPDSAKPDAAKPDGAKPDGAKPDGAKPDGAKPDAANPDGAKPDGAKPDGAKPDGAKPDGAKPDGAKPADAPKAARQAAADAKALAGDQNKNADATAQAAAELPAAAAEAAQPLNAAKGDMQQAAGDLQKGDPAAARPDEKQAVANLEKAKDAIDKKINDLQNQLGQPPADAQAAANAGLAQAIAKAQGDVAQAMQPQQGAQSNPQGQAAAQPAQGEKPQGQGEKPQGQGQPAQAQGEKPQGQGNPEQAKALQNTAQELSNAAAEASAPAAVDAAIAQATEALAQAAGAAEAGDKPATQSNAASAQAALAQAAAALAMAQQGASSNAQANAQGKGQGQGQEQGQGEGQEQGQGEGPGQGQGQEGQGKGPSQSTVEGQGQGTGQRQSGHASAADNGERGNNRGKGQFINLPKRDRNAIMQSRKESAPSEYAPAIEQYLRNLADSEEK